MKGLFWEFLFFSFPLHSRGGRAAVLDQFLPEQGVSCFVILVRFWKDNYPPLLIICILRAPTQRTCSKLGRDGRERDEKEGMERQRGIIAAASGMSALSTMLPRTKVGGSGSVGPVLVGYVPFVGSLTLPARFTACVLSKKFLACVP